MPESKVRVDVIKRVSGRTCDEIAITVVKLVLREISSLNL